MAMKKESNLYTVLYIIVMVTVVGAALAFTSMALADKQQKNIDADKMRQILSSVHIPAGSNVAEEYNKYVVRSFVIDSEGREMNGVKAFDVNVAEQSKLPAAERRLPVYECRLSQTDVKYILPVYGAGLWGPIWGYVAVDSNGTDIYGAYFGHQGETPGLGAEIEKPDFTNNFNGKTLWRNDNFAPVEVVKKGQKPVADCDYVDGISGGTITSKGVSAMLSDGLTPYKAFLEQLKNKK